MVSFRSIATIVVKDVKAVFVSPLFYVISALCTAIWSLMFFSGLQNFAELSRRLPIESRGQVSGANIHDQLFKGHISLVNFILIFAVAAITMRLISEEKRNRTFDLLWTSPISATEIILGKFVAGIAVVWTLVALSMAYPISSAFFADLEWMPLISSYLGMFLLGACYVAVGLFASSLTQSSVLSVFIALMMNIGLWLVAMGADMAESPAVVAIFKHISVGLHLQDFMSGVIKLSSIVLFLSICAFLGLLAEISIKFSALSVNAGKISRTSKIFFFLSLIAIVTVFLGRYLIGGWFPFLWILLGVGFFLLGLGFVLEFKVFQSLLGLKTTRKGLNIGAVFFLTTILLGALNFIAFNRDVTWDVTDNKINTLSSQSQKVLKSLDERLRIVLFYVDEKNRTQLEGQIQPLVRKYENYTKNILFESHDANKKPGLANEFGFKSGPYGLYMQYKGRTVPIYQVTEEDLTNAMANLSRDTKKVIYFVEGHGETSLERDGNSRRSISLLKKEMELTFYEIKKLNLRGNEIPKDASVVAIVGPQTPITPGEIEKIVQYAKQGGRILIAADPAEEHNIFELTEKLGVDFSNTIILDENGRLVGRDESTSFGIPSRSGLEITKNFPTSPSMHLVASPLKKHPKTASKFEYEKIVTTDSRTVAVDKFGAKANIVGKGPFTLGFVVKGQIESAAESAKGGAETPKFHAIVYGDSDFLADTDISNQPVNFNLALNSFNYLSDDKEFIGIRPKKKNITQITLTSMNSRLYLLGFCFPIPLLFFAFGSVIWFTRRSS